MITKISNITLLSLGCPKNQVDSEILLGQLNHSHFRHVQDPNQADILIINTCSFIQDAIRESVDEILSGINWKLQKPGRKLLIMGCLPQRFPDDLANEMPEVDGFFGVGDFSGIIGALNGSSMRLDDLYIQRKLLSPPHTAYLRISDGCSQRCRYCTIPRIRGPYRSRKPEDVIREAKNLAAKGVVEIIVIGQETTSYGLDLHRTYGLLSLLADLSQIDGIRWIRLMYSHPPTLTDHMIHGLGSIDNLCPYLDFPIEHASDRVLQAMGRKSTQSELHRQINLLRETVPNIALRTSVIVGYPGESDVEFSELVNFLDEIRFDHLGVFTFSPEEGTPAKDLPGAISSEEAQDRRDQLMMMAEEWAEERNQSRVGQNEVVLVDEVDTEHQISIGRTYRDAPEIDSTVIINEILRPGIFEKVNITGYRGFDLIARTLNTRAA